MNNTWKIKKLLDVCEVFTDGDWIEKKDQSLSGIRLIQTCNIGSSIFKDREEKARYISEITFKKLRCTEIFPNDCLISRLPDPVGRSCIIPDVKEPMITVVDCTIVRFQKKIIIPKWFIYYTLSQEYQIQINRKISGATRQRISRNNLGLIDVPLPSLTEQRRIVTILDKVFSAIDEEKSNAEKNLRNVKLIFDCYLNCVLADKKWDRKIIGEVCDRVEYGSSSKSKQVGEVAVLRMGNIQNGRFIWDKLVYSDDADDNRQYFLKYNDVLFNRTNSPELVGKTAIYKGEMPAIFAGYLIRLHRKEKILDADYLCYYLNSEMAIKYGKTVVISSVNQANINGTKLKGYPIPCPPLKDQQVIVQKLDVLSAKTKKLEAIYQAKINKLEKLKKSFLHKAFSGELSEHTDVNTNSKVHA